VPGDKINAIQRVVARSSVRQKLSDASLRAGLRMHVRRYIPALNGVKSVASEKIVTRGKCISEHTISTRTMHAESPCPASI
jgi:hypothetical protein